MWFEIIRGGLVLFFSFYSIMFLIGGIKILFCDPKIYSELREKRFSTIAYDLKRKEVVVIKTSSTAETVAEQLLY